MRKIHVACCFDDAMAVPASVVGSSVAANTKDAHVCFYMLHPPGLSAISIADLRAALQSERFSIIDCPITEDFSRLHSTKQYSAAMYYRFLLPDIVPAERVIYLDCDVLVRKSLVALYETDLRGHPLGAARDYGLTCHMADHGLPVTYLGEYISLPDYCRKILSFDLTATPYFNSGVMLMNLNLFKQLRLAERCIGFSRENPGLGMADQDSANAVLQGDFLQIDTRWNSFSYLYKEYFPEPGRKLPEIFGGFEKNFTRPQGAWLEILSKWAFDPWIVHFAYMSKPWVADHRRTDYDDEFWRYALRTPYGAKLQADFRAAARRGGSGAGALTYLRNRAIRFARSTPFGRASNRLVRSVRQRLLGPK